MRTNITKYERGNKTITLIGVCHIGTLNYYKNIQKELDKPENDLVLYEGVTGFSKEKDLESFYNLIAEITGLGFQKELIKYRDGWINSDLDKEIIFSADPNFFIGGSNEKVKNSFDKLDNLKESKLVRGILLTALRFLNVIKAFVTISFTALELRNYKIILDVVESLINNDNLCLFYGDAHMKGISKALLKMGFKKVSNKKMNPLR